MEPSTHTLNMEAAPVDLLPRLRAALDDQGSPAIAAARDGDHFVFAAETGEWMLAARVADALSGTWAVWVKHVRG